MSFSLWKGSGARVRVVGIVVSFSDANKPGNTSFH
jgi:hypothetical protein